MIDDLIKNLVEYKTSKAYESYDFEADLVTLYGDLRGGGGGGGMTEKYPDFGPMAVYMFDTDWMSEKNLVT